MDDQGWLLLPCGNWDGAHAAEVARQREPAQSLRQQRVRVVVYQRDARAAVLHHARYHGFERGVGGKDVHFASQHGGRQTDMLERQRCSAGTLKGEPGREHACARQMRPQFVEPLHDWPLDRAALE